MLISLYIECGKLWRALMKDTEEANADSKTAGDNQMSLHKWYGTDHSMITTMELNGKRYLARLLPSRGSDDALANDKEMAK